MIPAPSLARGSFLFLYGLLDCSLKLKLLGRLGIIAALSVIESHAQLLLFKKERTLFFQGVPINRFGDFVLGVARGQIEQLSDAFPF